jgi:hypothetical protein
MQAVGGLSRRDGVLELSHEEAMAEAEDSSQLNKVRVLVVQAQGLSVRRDRQSMRFESHLGKAATRLTRGVQEYKLWKKNSFVNTRC